MEKANILVVDDSINILSSLGKILEINGYQVDTAPNGSDALRKLQKVNYDLVICDIEMPGITGLDFLKKVRQSYGGLVDVILMTGYMDQEYFIKAIRLGAADFIQKPIDGNLIIRSIDETLKKKREQNNLSEFYRHLDATCMKITINPRHFAKYSISKVFSEALQIYYKVPPDLLNEILICIDEMVYNAFIHGTLNLTPAERTLDSISFHDIVFEKLSNPMTAQKRIYFTFHLNAVNNVLEMEVEDEGMGFDYESWLASMDRDMGGSLLEYGRGISLLYHLSDKLEFSKQGRCLKISKNIAPYYANGSST